MKAALYARVSTDKQKTDMQMDKLRAALAFRKVELFREYEDTISSREPARPQLEKLMQDARAQRFNVVIVWKFDRFARSTQELLAALQEFRNLGIDFVSLTEGIDTSTTVGKMVFTIIGAIAEFERDLIRERVISALQTASAQGIRLGRPTVEMGDKNRSALPAITSQVRALRAQGKTFRQIAEMLHISPATALKKAKVNL